MKGFFEDQNGTPIQLEVDSSTIAEIIDDLANGNIPFFRLEGVGGDYLQCAGKESMFTVELRKVDSNGFKHYIIGRPNQSKVWKMIYCSVGPIRVLEHEVLSKDEVKLLCSDFNINGNLPDSFIKRNVTKLHK